MSLLCFGDGYSRVARRPFEVMALLSPLPVFTQAFWAALDMDRGSIAEWHHCDRRVTRREAFESRQQAASHHFPILVGMLGASCSCTPEAA